MTYIETLATQFGLSDNSMREIRKMMTEHDVVKHRQIHETAMVNEIVDSGAKTFITAPIEVWGETKHKLREIDLISFENGRANIIVNNSIIDVRQEDILIERLNGASRI